VSVTGDTRLVVVADEDPRARALVSKVLRKAGYATREASTGEEALDAVRRESPQLVILDVALPDICGYEVCRELRDEFGEALPIVFVSGVRTEWFDRVAGFLVGADDQLVKPFAPDELLVRVERLARRWTPISEAVASKLTKRERQVFRLLLEGREQDEIAGQLVISPRTVSTHIENILRKLGVKSRAQAVALAYREGHIQIH
jgi:DNA-binding NarL/FixJ family response regulator